MAIINIASVGKFSSDRAISEYATELWGVTPTRQKFPEPYESVENNGVVAAKVPPTESKAPSVIKAAAANLAASGGTGDGKKMVSAKK